MGKLQLRKQLLIPIFGGAIPTICNAPRQHDGKSVGDVEGTDEPRELRTGYTKSILELSHIDVDVAQKPGKKQLSGGADEDKNDLGGEIAEFRRHALGLSFEWWRCFVCQLIHGRELRWSTSGSTWSWTTTSCSLKFVGIEGSV